MKNPYLFTAPAKYHKHTPPHIFLDSAHYFITGAIYKKRPLLKSEAMKLKLLDTVRKYFNKYKWELNHWVILNNHYHLMGKSEKGDLLTNIMKGIHGASSHFIRKETRCDIPVWWNYWDYCIRNEKDYYTRLNYLLNNPIKHGYVTELNDYTASSFLMFSEKTGQAELDNQFKDYPAYQKLVIHEAHDDDF